jgi:hypothetical protein
MAVVVDAARKYSGRCRAGKMGQLIECLSPAGTRTGCARRPSSRSSAQNDLFHCAAVGEAMGAMGMGARRACEPWFLIMVLNLAQLGIGSAG